jgi:hypothetical protein
VSKKTYKRIRATGETRGATTFSRSAFDAATSSPERLT